MKIDAPMGEFHRTRPPSVVELAIVTLPPVASLVLLAGLIVGEAFRFRPFSAEPAATVSEAAATGAAARAVQLVRQGQDPNRRWPVRAGVLDPERHDLTPIDAAILGRRAEMIGVLRGAGALVADLERAACLARARGVPEARDYLAIQLVDTQSDPEMSPAEALRSCNNAD
jgi:hypothetical protein